MPLSSGTRLGPYEIIAPVGAGGMGEVYRAKDTRLDRIVAIKVLPSHLSSNPQLKQRFEREARAISSLSHPHICALHDIGHQNGTDYLVMEYLEGESLSHRLDKGPLPTEQVLRYGVQIAEALDKAHRQGIIHRDLKPGNVMLTKAGAKLLDFGLAKYEGKAQELTASELATRDRPLTEEGSIVGTVQYMAPEQLEGREADTRTDIFALGTIVYEMATGQRTFKGNSKAQLIAAILSSEPVPISSVQPMVPPALDHVVRKCVTKDPDERWQSAHDVASELKWISEQTSQTQMAMTVEKRYVAPRFLARIPFIILSLITVAAILIAYHYYQIAHTTSAPEVTHLSFPIPENTTLAAPGSLAISPDGRQVAFCVTSKEGITTLWVRSLGSFEAQELSGTNDAAFPFWSPDNRFIGFFAQGRLKKIDVNGGPAQAICDISQGRGGTWNAQGKILLSPMFTKGLHVVSASEGSMPTEVTKPDLNRQENAHRWPYFLPDGQHFLFTIRSAQEGTRGIYVGSLNSKEKKRLLPDQTKAEYVAPGYLIFVREENLMTVPFDAKTLQISGEPVALAQGLDSDPGLSTSSFSVSPNSMIYMNSGSIETRLFWFDRAGKQLGVLGRPITYFQPVISPDGKKVVIGAPETVTGSYDLWIGDLLRGTFSRSTSSPASDNGGIWSSDGSKIFFSSNRGGVFDLYEKEMGGGGIERLLLHTDNYKAFNHSASDGRYLLYEEIAPKTNSDLWILPLFGDRKPFIYLQTEFNEAQGQFSPDGKWIAYASDDTGRAEIYVQSFPITTGAKRQISTAGGSQPTWSHNQKELYYLSADGKLMAVSVTVNGGFEPGTPEPLFETHFSYNPVSASERAQYDVTPDGQRFLLNNLAKQSSETPINIILNWNNLLK